MRVCVPEAVGAVDKARPCCDGFPALELAQVPYGPARAVCGAHAFQTGRVSTAREAGGGGVHVQVGVLLLPGHRAAPGRLHPRARAGQGTGVDELCDAEATVALLRVLVCGVDAPVDDEDGALGVGDDELF
jgi:hypothetical protein